MWMVLVIVMLMSAWSSVAMATQDSLKDPEGKTLAVILDCNKCQQPKAGKQCETGVLDGFHDGKPCGECLLTSNHGFRIPYAQDLIITGTLHDEDGKPLKGRYVKVFLPNTWSVRTKTVDNGIFRLVLGATLDRKGKPIVHQLGVRTMRKDSKAENYALYMLPEGYKACEAKKK
jgi:hypothetical protein